MLPRGTAPISATFCAWRPRRRHGWRRRFLRCGSRRCCSWRQGPGPTLGDLRCRPLHSGCYSRGSRGHLGGRRHCLNGWCRLLGCWSGCGGSRHGSRQGRSCGGQNSGRGAGLDSWRRGASRQLGSGHWSHHNLGCRDGGGDRWGQRLCWSGQLHCRCNDSCLRSWCSSCLSFGGGRGRRLGCRAGGRQRSSCRRGELRRRCGLGQAGSLKLGTQSLCHRCWHACHGRWQRLFCCGEGEGTLLWCRRWNGGFGQSCGLCGRRWRSGCGCRLGPRRLGQHKGVLVGCRCRLLLEHTAVDAAPCGEEWDGEEGLGEGRVSCFCVATSGLQLC